MNPTFRCTPARYHAVLPPYAGTLTMPTPLQLLAPALLACLLSASAMADLKKGAQPAPNTAVVLMGTPLVLNGAGFRYRGSERVTYVEIHAPRRFRSLDELLKQAGPKRVVMTLMRDMPAGMTGKALARGIEDNLPRSAMAALVPSLLRMTEVFGTMKNIAPGDQIVVDWVPGQGSVVSFKGKQITEPLPQPEFFAGFVAMWIGTIPVDAELKQALLGRS